MLKAERAIGRDDIAKIYRKAIDNATRQRGFVEWDKVGDYAANLEQIVILLQELLTPKNAGILAELTGYAIERVESALDEIDASNGEVFWFPRRA